MWLIVTGIPVCGKRSSFERSLDYFASQFLLFGLGTSMTQDTRLSLESILTHVNRTGLGPTFSALGTHWIFG